MRLGWACVAPAAACVGSRGCTSALAAQTNSPLQPSLTQTPVSS